MDVELIRENEDGSADFTFHLSGDEMTALLLFGLRRALEEAVQRGKEFEAPIDGETNE